MSIAHSSSEISLSPSLSLSLSFTSIQFGDHMHLLPPYQLHVVARFMMIEALKDKGYNGYDIAIPSLTELLQIFKFVAPVFIVMMSKVAFYSLLVYFSTSMGLQIIVAHQAVKLFYKLHTHLCQNLFMLLNESLKGTNIVKFINDYWFIIWISISCYWNNCSMKRSHWIARKELQYLRSEFYTP
ncbi:hypothetical protein Lser_V15G24571 [Lactuca serriola]